MNFYLSPEWRVTAGDLLNYALCFMEALLKLVVLGSSGEGTRWSEYRCGCLPVFISSRVCGNDYKVVLKMSWPNTCLIVSFKLTSSIVSGLCVCVQYTHTPVLCCTGWLIHSFMAVQFLIQQQNTSCCTQNCFFMHLLYFLTVLSNL